MTLLTDGNMEAATTAAWTAGASATLTKETGTPHGGSRVLRIARNAVNNPYAYEAAVISSGVWYRLQGWARSDGNAVPAVYDPVSVIWTGTTSTDWQPFDLTFLSAGTTVSILSTTSTGTEYTEWDDLTLIAMQSGSPDLDVVLFYVDWDNDGFDADDVVHDVESVSITIGALGGGQRVASVGTLEAVLDNSSREYSSKNASGSHYSSDWIGLPVQVVVNDGTSDLTIFTGTTEDWLPDSNLYGGRLARVVCSDKMADFQRIVDLGLILRGSLGADELLKMIGAAVYRTAAATATLTFTSNANDGDTATVDVLEFGSDTVYTFKNTPAAAYDVQIGASAAATAANFAQAVLGDPQGIGSAFYTGTLYHLLVTATSSSNVVTVTARSRGTWANEIRLQVSAGTPTPRFSWSGATLSGGADGPSGSLSYDSGVEEFEYAGDQWLPGEWNGVTAIQDIVTTEWGWFGIGRDGVPVFKNRQYQFLAQASSSVTVDNTQSALINPRLSRTDIGNRYTVGWTPRRALTSGTIGTAPPSILVPGSTGSERWNGIDPPGDPGTVIIKVPFKDQTSGRPIAATRVNPLIAGTHYTVNEAADGSGVDYTTDGSLTLSYIVASTYLEITFINTALGPLYVNGLYIEGLGLVSFDEQQVIAQDSTSITTFGLLEKSLTLPLPTTNVFPEALATYLTSTHKDPILRYDGADYDSPSTAAVSHLLNIDLFDVISVSDDQLSVSAERYIITGASYELVAGDVSRVALFGELIDDYDYLILDVGRLDQDRLAL